MFGQNDGTDLATSERIARAHDRFGSNWIDDGRVQGQHYLGPGARLRAPRHQGAPTPGGKHAEPNAQSQRRLIGQGARKPNPALMKPLQPSKELAAVVGSAPLPRPQMVSRVWDYIKRNNLQNPKNRREILADAKLRPIFGKDKVTMFEMNRYLAQHLK